MSRQQRIKKAHGSKERKYSNQQSSDLYPEDYQNDNHMNGPDVFSMKYEAAKKQLTNLPNFENDNVNMNYINSQNESTYTDADGKFVMVDQVRYNNLLNKLNELQREFAELNRDADDGRDKYTVNKHYRKMQTNQVKKAFDDLNEEN